jgi:hypothetical protein
VQLRMALILREVILYGKVRLGPASATGGRPLFHCGIFPALTVLSSYYMELANFASNRGKSRHNSSVWVESTEL